MVQRCAAGQAVVLARWEDNSPGWREGGFFEIRSRRRWQQEAIGEGGDLWIVVSRPSPRVGRLYTVSFRLRNCRLQTYSSGGRFGRYAVVGDPQRSRFFATAEDKLLLLALRFAPTRPISGPENAQLANSLRAPRCLADTDVELLERYTARDDRWAVFISYSSDEHKQVATQLADALQVEGVSVFRDQDTLRGGDQWWSVILRSIERSGRFVLLMGARTQRSEWVQREVRFALEQNLQVVPVYAGGHPDLWGDLAPELKMRHALSLQNGVEGLVAGLVK